MTWAKAEVTTKSLRKADYDYYRDMVASSAYLRDLTLHARGELAKMPPREYYRALRRSSQKPRRSIAAPKQLPKWRSSDYAGGWKEIVAYVAASCNVPAEQMTGRCRLAPYVRARGLAMVILHRRGCSYPQIGRWMGGRDHSTVISMVRKITATATDYEREIIEAAAPVAVQVTA